MAVSVLYENRSSSSQLSSTPPAGLDTWGLQPIDYRLNQDLHLLRRYPSPLTHFGLGSRTQKQKKVITEIILTSSSFS